MHLTISTGEPCRNAAKSISSTPGGSGATAEKTTGAAAPTARATRYSASTPRWALPTRSDPAQRQKDSRS